MNLHIIYLTILEYTSKAYYGLGDPQTDIWVAMDPRGQDLLIYVKINT